MMVRIVAKMRLITIFLNQVDGLKTHHSGDNANEGEGQKKLICLQTVFHNCKSNELPLTGLFISPIDWIFTN